MNYAYRWAGGNGVGRAVNIGFPIRKGLIQYAFGPVRRDCVFPAKRWSGMEILSTFC